MSTERELLERAKDVLSWYGNDARAKALHSDIDTHLKESVRDAENELNCAEEVLDSYAVNLPLEQTHFDCVGDYIEAVLGAAKAQPIEQARKPLMEEQLKIILADVSIDYDDFESVAILVRAIEAAHGIKS